MTYWLWLIIALICLIIELSTGAFVLVFFAGAAVIVALTTILVLENLAYQILFYGLLGILSLIFFRKKLIQAVHHHKNSSAQFGDQNQTLLLEEDLAPQQEARVSYQGSLFTAVNMDQVTLKANHRVRILKTDGIKLHLVSEHPSPKK